MARLGNDSIACYMRDTRFDLTFSTVGNIQTMSDVRFTWLDPNASLKDTSWIPAKDGKLAVYKLATQALATLLNGAITASASFLGQTMSGTWQVSLKTARTRIMTTALIGLLPSGISTAGQSIADLPREDLDLAANKTLGMMIEELSRNQTLSLFSSERFW